MDFQSNTLKILRKRALCLGVLTLTGRAVTLLSKVPHCQQSALHIVSFVLLSTKYSPIKIDFQ